MDRTVWRAGILYCDHKNAFVLTREASKKSPKTPYQRLLESPDVSEESKAELTRRKSGSDPVDLNNRLNRAIERLLKLNREKDTVKQPSGQEAGQAEAV